MQFSKNIRWGELWAPKAKTAKEENQQNFDAKKTQDKIKSWKFLGRNQKRH